MTIKIGKLALGKRPNVAFACGDFHDDMTPESMQGVSVLEARIDWFSSQSQDAVLSQLQQLRALKLPILATIRPTFEAGSWASSEAKRLEMFLACLPVVEAVDIELAASQIQGELAKACKAAGKTLLVSNHDLEGTPDQGRLAELVDMAKEAGADIVKLACHAKTADDVVRLLRCVADHRAQGMIGISMGPLGALSRVAGPMFGSLLSYTSKEQIFGQLPLDELLRNLRAFYPEFK
jgi:3-dehydroquinate dehydratase-1